MFTKYNLSFENNNNKLFKGDFNKLKKPFYLFIVMVMVMFFYRSKINNKNIFNINNKVSTGNFFNLMSYDLF